MAFWGAEVEAGKPLTVKPDKGKLIHLSQASIECKGKKKKKKKGESTSLLYVSVDDGNKLVIGTLCQDKFPHISFDLVFDKEFVLSHSLEKETVHFIGYQSPKEDGEEEEEETPKQLEPRNKKRANESAFIEPVSAKKTKLTTTTTFQKTDLVKALSTPPPPRCIPPSTILPPLSSVNVLWDMVSCPFPHSQVKASNVKKNISAALTLGSLNLYDIQAFVYDKDYHGDYKHKLDMSEIKVVSQSIKSAKRDHADVKMAKTMYSWALDHKLPPAPPILIISSNEELMKEIEILKKNGFHVILAHNEEVSMDMKRSASQCIALKHLLRGIWKIDKIPRIIENITGKGKKRKGKKRKRKSN